ERIGGSLGNPFEVVDPGLSPKLYPCCSDLHAAIDALLDLRREEDLTPEQIRHVRCGLSPIADASSNRGIPTTPLEAKFSMTYCGAAALSRGRVGMAEFEPEAIAAPEL